MNRFLRAVGWVLTTLGVVFALLAVAVAFDPKEKDTDARLGMIMFALFGAVPGGLLLWRTSEKVSGERAARGRAAGKCGACGASLAHVAAAEGEPLQCPYCGSTAG